MWSDYGRPVRSARSDGQPYVRRGGTVRVSMAFDLACDSCAFARGVDEEWSAYRDARAHESEHPTHFVLIETTE